MIQLFNNNKYDLCLSRDLQQLNYFKIKIFNNTFNFKMTTIFLNFKNLNFKYEILKKINKDV